MEKNSNQTCILCGNTEQLSSPKEKPEIKICELCWTQADDFEARFDPTPF